MKKRIALLLALTLLSSLFGCDNVSKQETESDNIVSTVEAENKTEAKPADAPEQTVEEETETVQSIDKSLLESAGVGSYITFGKYEQDNDLNNGSEDIEWLVLAKENNKMLVISRYGLECHEYNTTENITWENCSLRSWLNQTFYDTSFNSGEKSAILLSTVTADPNPSYETPAGNDCMDNIFLLSIVEAQQYFADDDARICQATAYVAAKTDNLLDGNCWWWLRSPGYESTCAAGVIGWGGIATNGSRVWGKTAVVRPAMWLSLEP